MPELHARLLEDVLALGSPYPLVLTGGYAVQAHQLVDRPSQDLDVATQNPAPMADIAHYLVDGLTRLGWRAETIEVSPLSARFLVTDPDSGQECEVDILKEVFWHPTVPTSYGPVLSEQDVIGTKVRAIAERGAARDLIDVYAASHRWTTADLEEFGRRHAAPTPSSAPPNSRPAWSAPTGSTTPSSPRTDSTNKPSPTCAPGPAHGPMPWRAGPRPRTHTRRSTAEQDPYRKIRTTVSTRTSTRTEFPARIASPKAPVQQPRSFRPAMPRPL